MTGCALALAPTHDNSARRFAACLNGTNRSLVPANVSPACLRARSASVMCRGEGREGANKWDC